MKFNIGDRVGKVSDSIVWRESAASVGEVTDVTVKGLVLVNWDDAWDNRHNVPLDPSELMLEVDLLAKVSVLEQEFDAASSQIKQKLIEAGQLITEAQVIAKSVDKNLADMYNVYQPLYNAMDDAGWNTSSFSC